MCQERSDNYLIYWAHRPCQTDPFTQGYIGITNNFRKRNRQHRKDAGAGSTFAFHCAIRKHPDIVFVILKQGITLEEANIQEEGWRPDPSMGWNERAGGGCTGKSSEKTKARISAAKKGRKHTPEAIANMRVSKQNISPETRAKMSAANRNRPPMPAAQRAKVGDFFRGRKRSPETRAKISASKTGVKTGPLSPEHRRKLSEANRNPSPEIRAIKRAAATGHRMSEKTKAILRAANLGRKHTPETIAKMKASRANRHLPLRSIDLFHTNTPQYPHV